MRNSQHANQAENMLVLLPSGVQLGNSQHAQLPSVRGEWEMGEAMEFGNRTDVVTILSETSEDDTLSWKYIVMCLGQAQLFAGIPQVSEHESPKGSQQQVNPTVHIL